MEEVVEVLDCCLLKTKWHLRTQSKRRLQTDILALITEMRPVIMVDYGGKLPELQDHLSSLLKHCQKESIAFENLRVMVIEEMIYLVHVERLKDYVKASLNSEVQLHFINIEQDPPKMVAQGEESSLVTEFVRVQKFFDAFFSSVTMINGESSSGLIDRVGNAESGSNKPSTSQSSECIDLSSCMQDTQVTVPTLNGWLLGYPVVYLFSKEHISDAIYNLSTKYLHIFRITVSRNSSSHKGTQTEELLSFSVPYELSIEGSKETWAKAFLAQLRLKWEMYKQTWRSIEMDVTEFSPQAIVL